MTSIKSRQTKCKHNWVEEEYDSSFHGHAFADPCWKCTRCKYTLFDFRWSCGGEFILPLRGTLKYDKHGNYVKRVRGVKVFKGVERVIL